MELAEELSGIADLKRCFGEGDVESCIWVVVGSLGVLKALKIGGALAKVLPKIVTLLGARGRAVERLKQFKQTAGNLVAGRKPCVSLGYAAVSTRITGGLPDCVSTADSIRNAKGGVYVIYEIIGSEKVVVRTGRTKNFARREQQHNRWNKFLNSTLPSGKKGIYSLIRDTGQIYELNNEA